MAPYYQEKKNHAMYFPITGYDTLEKLSKNWNIKKIGNCSNEWT